LEAATGGIPMPIGFPELGSRLVGIWDNQLGGLHSKLDGAYTMLGSFFNDFFGAQFESAWKSDLYRSGSLISKY
jgi:hypothetical protein